MIFRGFFHFFETGHPSHTLFSNTDIDININMNTTVAIDIHIGIHSTNSIN